MWARRSGLQYQCRPINKITGDEQQKVYSRLHIIATTTGFDIILAMFSFDYTVESRYNAVVGVQETGPRYKWNAL